jgi:hypothetical protein
MKASPGPSDGDTRPYPQCRNTLVFNSRCPLPDTVTHLRPGPLQRHADRQYGTTIGSGVTESDIAQRAFELYCDRGCEDGHDIDDWLSDERELRDVSSSSAA